MAKKVGLFITGVLVCAVTLGVFIYTPNRAQAFFTDTEIIDITFSTGDEIINSAYSEGLLSALMAGAIDLKINGTDDPQIVNFSQMQPGVWGEYEFTLTIITEQEIYYTFEPVMQEGSEDLYNALAIELYSGSSRLFSGPLHQFSLCRLFESQSPESFTLRIQKTDHPDFQGINGSTNFLIMVTAVQARNNPGFCPETPGVDTDGDGLLDELEENGFDYNGDGIIDVDLPALGASKDHKDVFVQVDWLAKGGLFGHHHRPDQETFDKVIDAFARAPVGNPDGTTGINLHIVFGQVIEENEETKELGVVSDGCSYSWDEFDQIKNQNFDLAKRPIFHYVIFGHDLPIFQCLNDGQGGRPEGISRNSDGSFGEGASDFIVALGGSLESYFSGLGEPVELPLLVNARAVVFMHELGHNLGLGHGGVVVDGGNVVDAEHTNYKPNHLSVMNYSFGSRGLRKKNNLGLYWDGYLDYSRFSSEDLPDLNETNLNESVGLQASEAAKDYGTRYYCQDNGDTQKINGLQKSVDWNCSGDINENNISTNINKDTLTDGSHLLGTLRTMNEWQYLQYRGGSIGDLFNAAQLPSETSMEISPEITLEEDLMVGPFNATMEVLIDIKPGESVNSINLQSKGVVPVAILSSDVFDATRVDPTTILLAGAPAKQKDNGSSMVSLEDVNGDDLIDMAVKIETKLLQLTASNNQAILEGSTIDGLLIGGVDTVNIVK